MSRIDLDKLLKEISPDAPSGEEKSLYELEKMSKPEKDTEGNVISFPKWRDVQKAALKMLEETHDLRTAVILTRATLDTHGFKGLCDGVQLIQGYMEQFWETVYPLLDAEENDNPEDRLNPLWQLTDPEWFLEPIKRIPLCHSKKLGKFSLRDIHIANGTLKLPDNNDEKKEQPTTSLIEAAFMDSDKDELREIQSNAQKALARINALDEFLDEKVGADNAVQFEDLIRVLQDVNKIFVDQIGEAAGETDSSTGSENATEDGASSGDETPAAARSVHPGGIGSRNDVIRTLDLICEYYAKNEPTSPVPLLLQRAKRLVEKNFLEILADMAPESLDKVQGFFGAPAEKEEETKEKE